MLLSAVKAKPHTFNTWSSDGGGRCRYYALNRAKAESPGCSGVGGDFVGEAVAPKVLLDLHGVEAQQPTGAVVRDGRCASPGRRRF